MKKTAQIPGKPRQTTQDAWVSGESAAQPSVKLKRLTLDLHPDLHRRIKVACSVRQSTMVQEITKLLEREFPGVDTETKQQ